MAEMQKKKQAIVEDLVSKVKEPKVAEYLYRMAGMKSTLRGKVGYDLLIDTCKFLLDVIVEEKIHNDKPDEKSEDVIDQEENESFHEANESNDIPPNGENDTKLNIQDIDKPKAGGSNEDKSTKHGWETKKKICNYWRKGKCIKGLACKFDHPRICSVFMKYGFKKYREDSKGCHSGCDKLHPQMCKFSLKYNKCRYENCKYTHTTTTKIEPETKSQEIQNSDQQKNMTIQVPQWANSIRQSRTKLNEKFDQNSVEPFLSIDQLRLMIREALQIELLATFGEVENVEKINTDRNPIQAFKQRL
jgi:hypothetical protein